MKASSNSVLRDLGVTFLTGVAAGGLLMAGIQLLGLDTARALVDVRGDGLDLRDTAAVCWIFGQLSILGRYVLPGVSRL